MTTQPKRRRLPEEPPQEAAYLAALKSLNRRERSRAEIAELLERRGFDEETAEPAIERLIEAGLLDDQRLAHCFAEDKRDLAGWGEERITAALIERGIEPSLAEEAAREGHQDQADRALVLLSDRGEALGDDAARRRALGFLTRRGFAYEIAYDAIRRLAAQQR